MTKLEQIHDLIQRTQVEESYEPADLIQILDLLDAVVTELIRLDIGKPAPAQKP